MKKTIACILAMSVLLCGCTSKKNMCKVPDYTYIMSVIGQESEGEITDPPVNDDAEQPVRPPALAGFSMLGYVYDKATDFFGEYAWVQRDDRTKLLHVSGAEYAYTGAEATFKQDKYITESEGKLQLWGVRDGLILEGDYDAIEYEGNTVLAVKGSRQYVFQNGRPTGQSTELRLEILCDGWLRDVRDECIYNPALEKQTCGDYDVVYPETEGISVIRDGKGRYGYARADSSVLVAPRFVFADRFVNGYAIAKQQNGNGVDHWVIDKQGNAVVQTSMVAYPMYDGYFFFERKAGSQTQFALYTEDLCEVALPDGLIPYNLRVYGDYIIDLSRNSIFCLRDNAYLALQYTQIQPAGDCFIILTPDGSYTILSSDFVPILSDIPFVSFANSVFRFSFDSHFFFASHSS